MRRPVAIGLLLAAAALLLSLCVAEVVVRALGTADADGNFVIYGKQLRPHRMPLATTTEKIQSYRQAGGNTAMVYDPQLGWAPRPHGSSHNGLYHYNGQTLRSPREYEKTPPPGTVRIALFGDSFIHGDEVPFEQSLGYFLEQQLRGSGYHVEVLNFGVGGYGTDQALLRWRNLGKSFGPHIVIQGLSMENVSRNVNLVRSIYFLPTGLPFSKPRFVQEGEGLRLVNMPTLSPEQVPMVMRDFAAWEFSRYEYFFVPELFRERAWLRSRALAFVFERLAPPPSVYAPSGEPARLTLRILQEFASEVAATGAEFVTISLPAARELKRKLQGRPLDYADLLKQVAARFEVVVPDQDLLARARQSSVKQLFVQEHYSGTGNELVAAALAAHLRPRLDSKR